MYYELNRKMVEEKRLFHASPNVHLIGQKGFDVKLARSGGNFGPGEIPNLINFSSAFN